MSKTTFLGGRRTKIAAAVFAVMAIAGCASLGLGGGFQQPIVNFKDLKVRGLGLSGGSLDAYLNVYNPNGYKLDATRLTYTVSVDQNQLGTGALDSRFTVQNKLNGSWAHEHGSGRFPPCPQVNPGNRLRQHQQLCPPGRTSETFWKTNVHRRKEGRDRQGQRTQRQ